MKILLAGPGTGKTTRIKDLIKVDYTSARNILVLSFTNATVTDLTKKFSDNPNVRCYTLHTYALIINHLNNFHILEDKTEASILQSLAKKFEVELNQLSDFFKCRTYAKLRD